MIKNYIQKLRRNNYDELKNNYLNLLKKFDIQYLDGKTIETKEDCLNWFSKTYNFPNYFGNNYAALVDCMSDLDFRDEKGFILVIENWDFFLKNDIKNKKIIIDIFKDLTHYHEIERLTTAGDRRWPISFDVYLIDSE